MEVQGIVIFSFSFLGICDLAIDMAFAVDTSGSIGTDNFDHVKEFLISVVQEHDVGDDAAHFATIDFSDDANAFFDFNNLTGTDLTATNFGRLLRDLPYYGGETNINKALKLAETDVFSTKGGWRDTWNVPKVTF